MIASIIDDRSSMGDGRLAADCLLLCPVLAACSSDHREHLTLYSPHGREQLTLLEQHFEAANPDIDVRWLDMGSQDILDRLRFEKPNPVADVWFGGPTPIYDRGVAEGVLEPYRPTWWQSVDSGGVGPDDLYWPVYRTPAVIAFNSNLVKADDAPKDWDDVLLPKWRDKVLIRDPMASGTMRAIWGLIMSGRSRPRATRPQGDGVVAAARRPDAELLAQPGDPGAEAGSRRGRRDPLGPARHADLATPGHAVRTTPSRAVARW